MRMLFMLLALTAAQAAEVRAYLVTDGRAASGARMLAQSILRRAGVGLRWVKPGGAGAIRIELADATPEDLLPGALGVAHPYSGCTKAITVFADRVRRAAGDRPLGETALLGYVMAHEIAHVLQGMEHHSHAGVMKEWWSLEDRVAIYKRRLEFHEDDALLMQLGAERGVCRSPTARSGEGSAARPATP